MKAEERAERTLGILVTKGLVRSTESERIEQLVCAAIKAAEKDAAERERQAIMTLVGQFKQAQQIVWRKLEQKPKDINNSWRIKRQQALVRMAAEIGQKIRTRSTNE